MSDGEYITIGEFKRFAEQQKERDDSCAASNARVETKLDIALKLLDEHEIKWRVDDQLRAQRHRRITINASTIAGAVAAVFEVAAHFKDWFGK